MAAFLHFLLLLCSSVHNFNISQSKPTYPQPKGAISHVTKDISTLQYVIQIHHGTPLHPTNLVIDLGGPSLWLGCSSDSGSSSSKTLIPQSSIKCLSANPNTQNSKSTKCETFPQNRVTLMATLGDLAQDIIALPVVDGSETEPITSHFLFSCAPKLLLKGLATGARGMLGLGRTRVSVASQIAAAFGSKPQFILCLSPLNGVVLHDSGRYRSSFVSGVSDSFTYTPLVTEVDSPHEYFIHLKSIRVNGKQLALNYKEGLGGIKLSTIVPYSTMERSVYAVFVRAFEQAAMAMNMTRVASVAPFGLCFGSKNIDGSTRVGSRVPVVDLGLQSEMVKWRLHGRNSMVQVSDEVMCLGFLDGGLEQKTSIVLGGHQLEDTLLHFDLGASMLGFSSSKLMDQNTCSDLGLGFGFKDSM
ncbi:PREDICTED: basic 7S globulin-like [Fragaria vesca subsp. vesca]|uniref:basic 7S globulin-like n=1 Tax=Fragaria vesca subsp. vesca TaxID=101020 RepID=UPI0002C30EF1|nr:PREDICTED: basic 7S globulin-like [Fragaria vesca subsp. vesca]